MTTTPNLPAARVFVVEDEAIIRMLVVDFLDELGCEVVATAARLREAEDKARALHFDFALLDVNLAGELSYPVATVLQQRNIPFVLATGYGASAMPDALRGRPVLHKPFELLQLRSAMLAALQR